MEVDEGREFLQVKGSERFLALSAGICRAGPRPGCSFEILSGHYVSHFSPSYLQVLSPLLFFGRVFKSFAWQPMRRAELRVWEARLGAMCLRASEMFPSVRGDVPQDVHMMLLGRFADGDVPL
jgi:hypothetical protein